MRIIVTENYDELSKKAADIVASQLILKPRSVIGFATGGTPIGMYKEIVKMYREGKFSFKDVVTFNLDEYYGLDRENPQSYYFYMMEHLFKYVDIDKNNINIPDGRAEDIEKECIEYEEKIEKAGGIDLQILGIGKNGHIGFNEPDVKFEAKTHLVRLDEDTIKANSRFFNSIEEVPTKAISMGIKTIMHTRKIVLLASGKEKAEIIEKMVNGPITPDVPASILQLHPDVTLILDREAASQLNIK
ncbi:glucosamine-6-phosphate deaminase [Caloramator proteoclasticus]|uniref:Glucosamine-6-phosphate deaminase n=1 Tax=Caloramator proteoclasticus DSM 10124 TaxID=1121262 RepID=A0A1M4T244_9CLOT|nr:glucosamine-6-phosphate deaminase [Caloramator proteoclasticus]SHE38475.1 glucosamine-6-phosphate deaminase [Caloramator proteoclasticus DSM 10124]